MNVIRLSIIVLTSPPPVESVSTVGPELLISTTVVVDELDDVAVVVATVVDVLNCEDELLLELVLLVTAGKLTALADLDRCFKMLTTSELVFELTLELLKILVVEFAR